jgi:hypothetical protein
MTSVRQAVVKRIWRSRELTSDLAELARSAGRAARLLSLDSRSANRQTRVGLPGA